jgi:hypothetical protein
MTVGTEDGLEARRIRAALNQSLFRSVNEQIDHLPGALAAVEAPRYVCECLDVDCTQVLTISHAEYERIRAHPMHFVVLPGHQNLDVEAVVARRDWYVVVQKLGEGGDVAAGLDPRAARGT